MSNSKPSAVHLEAEEEAQQADAQAARLWHAVLEDAGSGVWEWNPQSGAMTFSAYAKSMLGYGEDDLEELRDTWFGLLHPDDLEPLVAMVEEYRRGALHKHRREVRLRCRDGHYKWILTVGRTIELDSQGRPLRVTGIHTDISELKDIGESLRQSEQRLQLAMEHAHMAWFERNITTGEIRCSQSLWAIYGYEPAAGPFTFEHVLRRMHPDDRVQHAATQEQLRNQTHNDEKTRVITYRVQMPAGKERRVEIRYRVSLDANDGQGSVYGLTLDITDTKKIEDALRANQARLLLSLEAAGTASWYWLIDENQVFSPDHLRSVYGLKTLGPWSFDEIFENVHTDDRSEVLQVMEKVRQRQTDAFTLEFRLTLSDGRLRWFEVRARAEYDFTGNMNQMFGVSVDITERRQAEFNRERMQQQLQQAQKMEALGLLTSGMAHDFNNILGSILGYTGLAQQRFGQMMPPKLAEYIGEVQAAGERARDLISQMLAFGRGESVENVPVEATDLVRSVMKILRPTLPSTIEIHLNLQPDLPLTAVDPIQFQQVLMNFCLNARDALGGTGNIWIDLSVRDFAHCVCNSCHADFTGHFIVLAVRDDGPGIPDAIRPRIFEPFFSTKVAGRGTGMGLAMTYSIAHRHGGHVLLEGVNSGGTSFELLLPYVVSEAVALAPRDRIDITPYENHSDIHVLIVDDEAPIGRFVGELLEMNGYRVTVESDPSRALQLLKDGIDRFALLITDQTMPRITGAELATECRRLNPALPVIMMTGFSATIDAQKSCELGIAEYLQKPLHADDLLAAIRKSLGDKKPHTGNLSQ